MKRKELKLLPQAVIDKILADCVISLRMSFFGLKQTNNGVVTNIVFLMNVHSFFIGRQIPFFSYGIIEIKNVFRDRIHTVNGDFFHINLFVSNLNHIIHFFLYVF